MPVTGIALARPNRAFTAPSVQNWSYGRSKQHISIARRITLLYLYLMTQSPDSLLFIASITGDLQQANDAISSGADTNAQHIQLLTPLHCAAAYNHLPIATLLLKHGANPNTIDRFHNTPLHFAAERHHTAITDLLLATGANPSARNSDLNSPTDLANERPGPRLSDIVQLITSAEHANSRNRS